MGSLTTANMPSSWVSSREADQLLDLPHGTKPSSWVFLAEPWKTPAAGKTLAAEKTQELGTTQELSFAPENYQELGVPGVNSFYIKGLL